MCSDDINSDKSGKDKNEDIAREIMQIRITINIGQAKIITLLFICMLFNLFF